jgi:hypothetical protein
MAAPRRGNLTVAQAGTSFLWRREVADVRQSCRHHLRERPGRRCGGGAGPPKIADCDATAVKSVGCQGKEAKEGILAVIIFHNRIVALFIAGSCRVLATTVDDWSENLFALALVRAYAYVRKYHNH